MSRNDAVEVEPIVPKRLTLERSICSCLRTSRWSEPVAMQYGGAPREQFYTNQTEPYFRAPHLYVAPAARFIERRPAITEEQAKSIGLRQVQGHSYGNDCADAVLLTTRAGNRNCPGHSKA